MRPHNSEKLVDKSFPVFRPASAEWLGKEMSYKISYEDRPFSFHAESSFPHVESNTGTRKVCTAITYRADLIGLVHGVDATSSTDETFDQRIVLSGIAIGASCALTTMLS